VGEAGVVESGRGRVYGKVGGARFISKVGVAGQGMGGAIIVMDMVSDKH